MPRTEWVGKGAPRSGKRKPACTDFCDTVSPSLTCTKGLKQSYCFLILFQRLQDVDEGSEPPSTEVNIIPGVCGLQATNSEPVCVGGGSLYALCPVKLWLALSASPRCGVQHEDAGGAGDGAPGLLGDADTVREL